MIRVATAPMNWNSDDLPDLRPLVPIEQVLAEMVQAGYEGTEYGTGLPPDPSEHLPFSFEPQFATAMAWRSFAASRHFWAYASSIFL